MNRGSNVAAPFSFSSSMDSKSLDFHDGLGYISVTTLISAIQLICIITVG
jgi:hypothetical protein